MQRYSAILVFQYRMKDDDESGQRKICEFRTITYHARSARLALKKAKSEGKKAQLEYKNPDGETVLFDFLGIKDMIRLGIECTELEVWYDIKRIVDPEKKLDKLTMTDEKLLEAIS